MKKELLSHLIADDVLHAKWLNTLSFLENCGARKIALCEHPTKVKKEMLKHANEEFRHAYHLKKQIDKLSIHLENYSLANILGGIASYHYLHSLDVRTSRYLSTQGLTDRELKQAAYILVTYAIELRASDLYPLYHEELRKAGSKVTVKSILLEEEEHLKEMQEELALIPSGNIYMNIVQAIENTLYQRWALTIEQNL